MTEEPERPERTDKIEKAAKAETGERTENRPLPKKEKVRPSYLWLLGALGGVFLALVVLSVQWKDSRKVGRVTVEGAGIFSEKDVIARAKVATGALIDTVSLMAVRARLVTHPYIRDARVSRDYPEGLRIEIEERIPVAMFTANGGMRYVDAEGVVLPYLESALTRDLPAITGVPELASTAPGRAVEGDEYFEALTVLSAALATDTSVYHLISEVDMREPDDVTIYSTEGAVTIRFGRGDELRKMSLLRAFWDRFVREEGPENLKSLDLRFGDRVVAKWAKKPTNTYNKSSM